MTTLLIYSTNEQLVEEITASSDLSDIIGAGNTLQSSVREIVPDLVYEFSLVLPEDADWLLMADMVDQITGGTCLIVQTVTETTQPDV